MLCCRGNLESSLKNYDEALRYFFIANSYFEEANDFGEQYLVLLTNMGVAYISKGDLLSGKLYLDEMKSLFEKTHGDFFNIKEDDLFIFQAYYGYMLQSIGKDMEAEQYYLNIINNCKRTSVSYEAYLLASNNLSNIYMKDKKWEKGINILKELRGPNSLSNLVIYQNLALGLLSSNKHQEVVSLLNELNHSFIENIDFLFTNFTEAEREQYWTETSNSLINLYNLIAFKLNDSKAISIAYDNILLCKNLTTNVGQYLNNLLAGDNDSQLNNTFHQYNRLKDEFEFKNQNHEFANCFVSVVCHLKDRKVVTRIL